MGKAPQGHYERSNRTAAGGRGRNHNRCSERFRRSELGTEKQPPSGVEHRKVAGRLAKDWTATISHTTPLTYARLIESMVAGPGRLGALCMHGGGSPAAAQMTVKQLADLERKKDLARTLAGLSTAS
jgi:hypothetical protein